MTADLGERLRSLPVVVRLVIVCALISAPLSILTAVGGAAVSKVTALFIALFVVWLVVAGWAQRPRRRA